MLLDAWEGRERAVIYGSPSRNFHFNCSGPAILTKLLVGAHVIGNGNEDPTVKLNGNVLCNMLNPTTYLNVYECEINGGIALNNTVDLQITQRNTKSQICFYHDGVKDDTPLMYVEIGESIR